MNKILLTAGIGTLALAFTAAAADLDDNTNANVRVRTRTRTAPASVEANATTTARTNTNVNGTRFRQRTYVNPHTSSTVVNRNGNFRNYRERNFSNTNGVTTNRVRRFDADHNPNVAVSRDRNVTLNRDRNVVNRDRNVMVNRDRTFVNRDRNVMVNRDRTFVNRNRNVMVTNNWRGSQFNNGAYTAFRNYHRSYHNRDWWRSHYNNIVFVNNGWYYWDAGYWFPAWGYDPYAYCPYDGPIYGYNQLAPDQVIVDVQSQLQNDGYYTGPVDGILGPGTRRAIALFQADHGLAVTAAIDEPTLDTLGLS